MQTKEFDHIDKIYRKQINLNDHSTDLASSMMQALKGGHSDESFIYELVQNADDAKAVSMRFLLCDEYLVVSHVGNHFLDTDIEKICGYARKVKGDKILDQSKTGQFGIGFKSVFVQASAAAVISGNYQFEFNQNHPKWHEENEYTYPWMTIPINIKLDKYPKSVVNTINPGEVTFIFTIRPEKRAELEKIFQQFETQHELILFLTCLRKIEVVLSPEKIKKPIGLLREDKKVITAIKRLSNPKTAVHWIKKTFESNIPEDILSKMQSQPNYCLDKHRGLTKINLDFAICYTKNNLQPDTHNNCLFAKLPTFFRAGLPYNVSAPFWPDSSREKVMDKAWNQFLMWKIGYFQFKFAEYIATIKADFRYDVLSSVVTKSTLPKGKLKLRFEQGATAAKKIAFIPSFNDPDELVSLHECQVDPSEVFYKFGRRPSTIAAKLIHERVNHVNRISQWEYGYEIDINKIFRMVSFWVDKTDTKHQDEFYVNLLAHLYKKSHRNEPILQAMRQHKLFLCANDGHLRATDQDSLYILHDSLKDVNLPIKLNGFNQRIYERLQAKLQTDIKPWFKSLNILEADFDLIIREVIIAKDLHLDTDQKTHGSVIRLLLSAYNHKVDLSAYPQLRNTILFTKNMTPLSARKCYLSNNYAPSQPLEGQLNEDVFVSKGYRDLHDSQQRIKLFLLSLAVAEQVNLNLSTITVRELKERYPKMANQYLDSLSVLGLKKASILNKHKLVNFIDIDNMQHINNQAYQQLFFQTLAMRWDVVSQNLDSMEYVLGSGISHKVPSFLQFYVRCTAEVITSQGKKVALQKSLSPDLIVLSHYKLPIAKITAQLSTEQIVFCGFKTSLSIKMIMRLLQEISHDHQRVDHDLLQCYQLLFKMILGKNLNDGQKQKIRRLNCKLPAADNSLVKVENLSFYNVGNEETPRKNLWLKPLPNFTKQQLSGLITLFGGSVVTQLSVNVNIVGLNDELYLKIGKVLPVVACYKAHDMLKSPMDYLQDWYEAYYNLKVYEVDYIYEGLNHVNSRSVYLDQSEGKLYFTGRWSKRNTLLKICQEIVNKMIGKVVSEAKFFEIFNLRMDALTSWCEHNQIDLRTLNSTRSQWNAMQNVERHEEEELDDVEDLLAITTPKRTTDSLELFDDSPMDKRVKVRLFDDKQSKGATVSSQGLDALDVSTQPRSSHNPILSMLSPNATSAPFSPGFTEKSSAEEPSEASDSPSTTKKKKRKKEKKPIVSSGSLFKPEIALEDLDGTDAELFAGDITTFEKKTLAPGQQAIQKRKRMNGPMTPKSKIMSPETACDIGFWGEKYVYLQLKKHYLAKYTSEKITGICYTELPLGFKLTSQEQPFSLEVQWLNRNAESGAHFDIIIIKNDETRYVEVKSTLSKNNLNVPISGYEILELLKHGDRYRFFRVFSVGKSSAFIKKIKDPAQLIASEDIRLKIDSAHLLLKNFKI